MNGFRGLGHFQVPYPPPLGLQVQVRTCSARRHPAVSQSVRRCIPRHNSANFAEIVSPKLRGGRIFVEGCGVCHFYCTQVSSFSSTSSSCSTYDYKYPLFVHLIILHSMFRFIESNPFFSTR